MNIDVNHQLDKGPLAALARFAATEQFAELARWAARENRRRARRLKYARMRASQMRASQRSRRRNRRRS